jgi:hypothetical protein
MRFITEFELEPPRNYEAVIERYKQEGKNVLGDLIEKSFGWEEKGMTTIAGPVKELFKLEIEAFPMDKWVEFKQKIREYLASGETDFTKVWLRIIELESYGEKEPNNG